MIEFEINTFEEGENGIIVTGVVVSGIISLGNRFEFAYWPRVAKDRKRVSFVVTRIMAYGHELDELHRGMSGELLVVGHGIEQLKHGILLGLDHE